MVLNFEDLNILNVNLVEYFTGSFVMLALLLCFVMVLVLLSRGLDIRYSLVLCLPLLAFFVAIGWFGTITNSEWVINIGLIVVSIIYGAGIVKLST